MNNHLSKDIALPQDLTLDSITSFAASALIIDEQQHILMMMRDDYPVWTTIGGIVESGETFEQALHREIKEETHLGVDIIHVGGDYFSPILQNKFRHERVFVCRPLKHKLQAILGDEGVCLEWIDPNNLPINVAPRYRKRIEQTLESVEKSTSLLILPSTKEFIKTLKREDIYGLDTWLDHPRVKKRKKSKTDFDVPFISF